MKLTTSLVALTLAVCSAACASSAGPTKPTSNNTSAVKDGGSTKTASSKPKTKVSTSKVSGLKGTKPPQGAKPQGTKSLPKVGGTTVPVQDVEVYLVALDFDGDGTDESAFWANNETSTFVWLEGPVACADGLSDGTGGFVAEIREDGSGSYLFAVDQCPEQNLFGCDFDQSGTETACGACEWDEAAIVCVAASE